MSDFATAANDKYARRNPGSPKVGFTPAKLMKGRMDSKPDRRRDERNTFYCRNRSEFDIRVRSKFRKRKTTAISPHPNIDACIFFFVLPLRIRKGW